MAHISMQREHELEANEVRSRIEKLAGKLVDRLGGGWHWEGDAVVCELHGAEARVGYDEASVSIDVTLPRKLRPFRKRLEAKIEESFDRYFRLP